MGAGPPSPIFGTALLSSFPFELRKVLGDLIASPSSCLVLPFSPAAICRDQWRRERGVRSTPGLSPSSPPRHRIGPPPSPDTFYGCEHRHFSSPSVIVARERKKMANYPLPQYKRLLFFISSSLLRNERGGESSAGGG